MKRHCKILFIVISCVLSTGRFFPALAQQNPHKNIEKNCGKCHLPTDWQTIRFDHGATDFELLAQHEQISCKSCHSVADFSRVSSNCASCHSDVHQAKMGNDCRRCHESSGWEVFNVEEIHENTQFPLLGAHLLVDCQSCHQNQQQGDFALLTTDCVGCHEQQYLTTENPNHVANSFSTDCQSCHDLNDWRPAFLDNHDAFFPIFSGEHDGAWGECADCHLNQATFTDFSCLTCHEHNQQEMDAKHNGIAGYTYQSADCLLCHPTGDKGEFDEHDTQFFPIFVGDHAGAWDECTTCHENPSNRKEFTCLVCHEHRQDEMNLKHSGIPGYAYLSGDCLLCHPNSQRGEFREHDTQFFPIFVGAHAGSWDDCTTCHENPSNRKEFTCLVCHEHRQSEMDAKHNGIAGYAYQSGDCLLCHPDSQKGEFREHDNQFFPIFVGAHAGSWDECTTCHENPSNRKEFTCLVCHEHRQSEMDAKHNGISGYVYQSGDCLLCHPNSEKGEFREHDNQFFPIFVGAHAGSWDECTTCHVNPSNRKEFTCLVCHEHRQSEMDLKHNGITGYVYLSNDCLLCHPDSQKGEFREHDNQFFPIFSGAHAGEWDTCTTCHKNPDNRKEFTCLVCHDHSQQRMDDKHLGEILDYVYASSACFDCHPNGKADDSTN